MTEDVKPNLDQTRITLSTADWEKFNEALDAPAEENIALRRFLAAGDPAAPLSEEELEWLNSPPVGKEII